MDETPLFTLGRGQRRAWSKNQARKSPRPDAQKNPGRGPCPPLSGSAPTRGLQAPWTPLCPRPFWGGRGKDRRAPRRLRSARPKPRRQNAGDGLPGAGQTPATRRTWAALPAQGRVSGENQRPDCKPARLLYGTIHVGASVARSWRGRDSPAIGQPMR